MKNKLVICTIIVFNFVSCGTQYVSNNQIEPSANRLIVAMPSNIVGEWKLLTVRGSSEDRFINIANDKAPTLSIRQDGEYSGYDGCNGYGGKMAVDYNSIVLSRDLSTSKGYPPYVNWHRAFHGAFGSINNYAIQGGNLLLKKDSHVLMTFTKR